MNEDKEIEFLYCNILMLGGPAMDNQIAKLKHRYHKGEYVEDDLFNASKIIIKPNVGITFNIPRPTSDDWTKLENDDKTPRVIVFDVTDNKSHLNAIDIFNKLDENCKKNAILVGFVTEDKPRIPPIIVKKYAETNGIRCLECVAKTGEGVDEVFHAAARLQFGKDEIDERLEIAQLSTEEFSSEEESTSEEVIDAPVCNILMLGGDDPAIDNQIAKLKHRYMTGKYVEGDKPNASKVFKSYKGVVFNMPTPGNPDWKKLNKDDNTTRMISYDITVKSSFENAKNIFNGLNANQKANAILVQNYSNWVDKDMPIVSFEEAEKLGIKCIGYSAKTGDGVEAVFDTAAWIQLGVSPRTGEVIPREERIQTSASGSFVDTNKSEASQQSTEEFSSEEGIQTSANDSFVDTGKAEEASKTLSQLHQHLLTALDGMKPESSSVIRTLNKLVKHAEFENNKPFNMPGKSNYNDKYQEVKTLLKDLGKITGAKYRHSDQIHLFKERIEKELDGKSKVAVNRYGSTRYESMSKLLDKVGGHFKYTDKKKEDHYANGTTEHLLMKMRDQLDDLEQTFTSGKSSKV